MKETPTVTISLTCRNSAAALDFYREGFGADELYRLETPEGQMAHAEILLGNTRIMMSDAHPSSHAFPQEEGLLSSCSFSIEVDNCDEACRRAEAAGAKVLVEPADQFYGMREAIVADPEGYRWHLAQKIEDLSDEELDRRAREKVQN
ncbi:MAG: VOC family protein [Verrucomicrobiota bacterium JB023]|nr:VOC family protein [Verrucomicrobiota bacterium JB023]